MGLVPWFPALKAEHRLARVTFDHVSVVRCMRFHSNDSRAVRARTPLCCSIGLNEGFDEEPLVALTEFLVVRQQLEDLFVVDDLLAAREARDRLGRIASDELRLEVAFPAGQAVLVATREGEELVGGLVRTAPERRTLKACLVR